MNNGQEVKDCCIDSAVSLISNIVETACELEHELDLMRLVNYIDLYHTYLESAAKPEYQLSKYSASKSQTANTSFMEDFKDIMIVSFDRFVRDSRLISFAAQVASVKSGHKVSAPPPLSRSAND